MLTDITITPMYVTDQEEALDFYVQRLGFEVETDADLGNMRWLTVRLPSAPAHCVLLQRIGDVTPTSGPETEDLLRELTARGGSSWMILASDDIDADHERLAAAGVEILETPTERPYGRDMVVRDPFGNQIRITQRAEG